ncbi:MAG: hypothetical protein WCI05_09470 [Myxococcales bacterium]
MKKSLSAIKRSDLAQVARLHDVGVVDEPWDTFAQTSLSSDEQLEITKLVRRFRGLHASLINEATLWSRLIYPLLVLAERGNVRAWAEVPISGQLGELEVDGVVDGALALGGADSPALPLLFIIECKRGTEATSPVDALYAALMCLASGEPKRPRYGCYTVGDDWTFAELKWGASKTSKGSIEIKTSREYDEKTEAGTILSVLKAIVDKELSAIETEVVSTSAPG